MTVLDGINDQQFKLDVELVYNQFGETVTHLNSGDSVVTDGSYRNGLFANGPISK